MTRNPDGLSHNATENPAYYDLPVAYRRAAHKATVFGIRHRVELCRVLAADHYLPDAWGEQHFVVTVVDAPQVEGVDPLTWLRRAGFEQPTQSSFTLFPPVVHLLADGPLECTRDPRDHEPGHGCTYESTSAGDTEPSAGDY